MHDKLRSDAMIEGPLASHCPWNNLIVVIWLGWFPEGLKLVVLEEPKPPFGSKFGVLPAVILTFGL